ncbi:MAG: threonine--tRNA ligase [Deltaproteobacteria bacterium CG2_30_63_29]|nr:MAG: threonine--tRNA ligase [Deltaproteobacteria bacterium CG2_30_63_29]
MEDVVNEPENEPASEQDQASRRKDKLFRLRHSTAHIMAQAVVEMMPEAKLAIGPPIADGFYYDFELPRSLSDADLVEIESRMQKIIKGNHDFVRTSMSRDEAKKFFGEKEQGYKLELIDGIADEEMSIYTQGGFVDLCAGPHVGRSKACKHFKLLSVAGAYWRGDSTRPMLQRIYGTVWPTKEELDTFLEIKEEAKRRDHRRLGKELDLFSFHPYSPGAAFWHPSGLILYEELVRYWRELQKTAGYMEIRNPLIYDSELYAVSGHLDHYAQHMFTLECEGRTMCLKPMNCPDTMLFYKTKKRSYRELPMRVAETQTLHRNELSGALSGLTRCRQFTQDDAHIFATMDQIQDEILALLRMVHDTYALFDLDYRLYLSTRPADFMGELALWDQAEKALEQAIEKAGKPYHVNEGDGAFYGPKIDIYIRDSMGRMWQCATIQLDFQLPERFELEYVGADNAVHRPVVIHRAVFGSIERFIGVLLEHLAGAMPTWLSPQQAIFLPINDDCAAYCEKIAADWRAKGVRAEVDTRPEKMGYKIRLAELAKIPYMLVAGAKEIESGTLSLRTYKDGPRGELSVSEIETELLSRIAQRTLDVNIKKFDLDAFVDVEDLDAEAKEY